MATTVLPLSAFVKIILWDLVLIYLPNLNVKRKILLYKFNSLNDKFLAKSWSNKKCIVYIRKNT